MSKLGNKLGNLGISISAALLVGLFVLIPLVGIVGLGKLLLLWLGVI